MTPAAQHLLAKIETVARLKPAERAAVLALPIQVREFRRGAAIVREGEVPTHCFAVLQGATAMVKFTGAGERHIVIFHFPSEIPDLHSLYLERMDAAIEAVTRTTVGFVPHEALRALCNDFPRINGLLWRSTLVDAAVLRESMLNISARPALARIAHLLCEFVIRLTLASLGAAKDYRLPITQAELGDCVGLSHVHVNRVLQTLRKKGLIELSRERLRVTRWTELRAIGDFDPLYLHLTPRQKAILDQALSV